VESSQLAMKMCIGAITRAESERDDPGLWKDMVQPHGRDIWRFG
jgi:hypothetical protein